MDRKYTRKKSDDGMVLSVTDKRRDSSDGGRMYVCFLKFSSSN